MENKAELLPVKHWHATTEEEAVRKLDTNLNGLNENQVNERRQRYGSNILQVKEPPTLVGIFLHQFLSPLIYILLVAGVISVLLGEIVDAIFIFGVVLLNAIIGTVQEWNAEKSAAALQNLLKVVVVARRDGMEQEINAEDLVPGDVVLLESGNKVPADIRLIQSNQLTVDESLLTGESIARDKNPDSVAIETALPERTSLLFAGSTVMAGRGLGLVVNIGQETEVGKIAKTVTFSESTKPPLVIRMERFTKIISYAILVAYPFYRLYHSYRACPMTKYFS
ncbi:hypothetical protein N752_21685 [Desulforamulus aquiferis]|nr:HAD-IC family P-type ATPase [Desulforamulus aquiferis]RYD03025.1 hypothetical protein N752_21685 [Desulforamulus aquiferis]